LGVSEDNGADSREEKRDRLSTPFWEFPRDPIKASIEADSKWTFYSLLGVSYGMHIP